MLRNPLHFMNRFFCKSLLALSCFLFSQSAIQAQTYNEIAEHYAELASATYQDSLALTEQLASKIDLFLADPNNTTLISSKQAWTDARKVYGLTEVFRFSHPVVDEWEPQVNAWPLDEGFIDYVDASNYYFELGNPVGQANMVATDAIQLGTETISTKPYTTALLASLNEIGGTEANVATGWHAIEFLLWGQDLNGTNAGAGERPYSDYLTGEQCTNGYCDRRREYLSTVTQLLREDLAFIVNEWHPDMDNYRATFLQMPADEKMRRVLYGIGSLALGELAGERMKVALYANSAEDEHDCFSDTTHNTLYANAAGVVMALDGQYKNISGELLDGPSLFNWAEQNTDLNETLQASADKALLGLERIVTSAAGGEAFDQLIAPGNTEGAEKINAAINGLIDLTKNVELLASAMELGVLNPDNAGHSFQ